MGAIGPDMAQHQWGQMVISISTVIKFGGGADSFAYALLNHRGEFLPRDVRDWTGRYELTNVVGVRITDTPLHDAFPDRDLQQSIELIPVKGAATKAEIADFITWHESQQNTYVSGQAIAISGCE